MILKALLTSRMRVFVLVWFGQLISFIGSSLTSFALGIWIYQQTGEVNQFAIVLFASTLPPILLAPVAGLLADRWSRRWTMVLADTGSALSTLVVVLLLWTNSLEPWHIYLSAAFNAMMATLQMPAYVASIPLLVPEEQLGRANGMVQLSRSLGQLIAPILGGVLLVRLGLQGVILIDLISFVFAVTTLLLVRFPDVPTSSPSEQQEPWLKASLAGLRYILQKPGLLALLLYFAMINFLLGGIEVLVTPLVLSITSADVLGVVLFVGGLGMLSGSVALSVWGTPRYQIYGVLIPQFIGGLCVFIAGLNVNVFVLAIVAFIYFFGVPIGDGCSTAIFQRRVAPDVQGRVFALISAIAGFILPISYIFVSLLADRVFEPMMQQGTVAEIVGPFIGVGKGRGIGLTFIIMGILAMVVTVLAYLYPPLRSVEDEHPDAESAVVSIDVHPAQEHVS